MSVLKTIGIQHLNGSSPNIQLDANGRVGVGTSSPRFDMSFGSLDSVATSTPRTIDLGGTFSNTQGSNLKIRAWTNGSGNIGLGVSSNQFDYVVSESIYSHVWYGASTERMRLTGTGYLTIPNHPMCWVTHNSVVSYSAGQLVQWTAAYDPLNMFSGASNYRVTVPVAGRYLVSVDLLLNNTSTGPLAAVVRRNGTGVRRFYTASGYSYSQSSMTLIVNCAANDYLDVVASEAASYWGGDIGNFTVMLIG
jgi:hypothetical protein